MSYGQLVTIESSIELDTSNLDERLDLLQETVDGLDGLTEEKVNDLIDSAIDGRNLVSSDDVDVEDLERRVRDIEDFEQRIADLENAAVQDGALEAFEERLAALESSRSQETTVVDLLRQLARALIG
jgi:hypothetical protein